MTSFRICLATIALTCGAVAAAAVAKPANDAAPATVTLATCAWDRPGDNPFVGDVVAAVDRYRDISPGVRARLKARMARRDYDDVVSIRRDSITGRADYNAAISDMHFGTHQVCRSVSRAAWGERMHERGLVYCDSGHCILVPTVCRNVSRIARAAVASARAAAPDDPGELTAAAPPGAGPADPAPQATPTPLAIDASPSFASPLAWRSPSGAGSPTGSLPVGGAAGLPELPSAPGPTAAAISAPPVGAGPTPPIALAPVPEPQTWGLMVGGLAVLLVWRRRRIMPRA